MAEILLKAQEETPVNPSSRRGDLVAIMPDGHPWGRLEGLPDFYVIRVPGRAVADVQPYARFIPDQFTGADTGVRRYYGHNSPPEWQAELAATGVITKTWEELAPYIVDKITGRPLAEVP